MTYCILQRVFVFILKQMVKTHPKSSCIQTLICYSFELAFLTKDQQTNQLWCLEVGDRSGRKQLRMTWFQDDMYRISFPFWMFHGFHGIYKQPSIIEVVWSLYDFKYIYGCYSWDILYMWWFRSAPFVPGPTIIPFQKCCRGASPLGCASEKTALPFLFHKCGTFLYMVQPCERKAWTITLYFQVRSSKCRTKTRQGIYPN